MSDYRIIKLNSENLGYLYTLHKAVYGKKQTAGYYHAKYDTSWLEVRYLGFFACIGEMPVAYYGIIPTRCSIRSEVVLASQSCDTMTHPDHRKKGLFIKLAQLTFQLAKESGIHFVFGFPNQNSYRGFIEKLGFSHLETLECYTLKFKNTLARKLYYRIVRFLITKRRFLVPNDLLSDGFDGLIYDTDYLRYKGYERNFSVKTSTAGHSVWLNLSHGAMIGAMWPLGLEGMEHLISFAKKKLKSASVTFMVSPGTNLSFILEKRKKQAGFAVIVKNLSGKYDLDKLKFQFADIDIF